MTPALRTEGKSNMTPALRTEGVCKSFGGFVANAGVSLTLAKGARHALIGPNGAGKTTLINVLTCVLAPSAGEIWLDADRVTTTPKHVRVKRGTITRRVLPSAGIVSACCHVSKPLPATRSSRLPASTGREVSSSFASSRRASK